MISILLKLFLIFTSEKLPRYTLKAIKSGGYTKEELDTICKIVKSNYTKYKKSLELRSSVFYSFTYIILRIL